VDEFEKRMSVLARTAIGKDVDLDVRREDEPAWDSLCHLKLVIAFEGEFKVRIPVTRIEAIRSLREFREFV
jgi:acyl carrier protein